MRVSSFFVIAVVASQLLALLPSSVALEDEVADGLEGNDTIQENPDFIEPATSVTVSDEDKDDDSDDDTDDDDDYDTDDVSEPEEEDDEQVTETFKVRRSRRHSTAKSAIDKKLKSRSSKPRKALAFLRKHKTGLILAVALYAFRREVLHFLYQLITVSIKDPETGKEIARVVHINPTPILKMLVFVHFMWRILGRTSEDYDSDPTLMSPAGMMNPGNQLLVNTLLPRLGKSSIFLPPIEQHWTFERVNERYAKDGLALQKATGLQPPQVAAVNATTTTTGSTSLSSFLKELLQKQRIPTTTTAVASNNGTVIIVDLTKLSTNVAQIELIRDQVSFLLSQHAENQTRFPDTAEMEIVCLLESPGGGAADYGLAAQQLLRLRNEDGIQLTICVDKVAASGGYMMACTASTGMLLAAPFAILGSIGVYGQAINVHDVLKSWGVKDLIFRAGKNKAPLGLIGEVTKDGMGNIQKMIDETHVAFKYHVATARPILRDVIDEVATGDVWLGFNALSQGLVDRLVSSDEYIGERIKQGARVLKLIKHKKPYFGFGPRPSELSVSHTAHKVMSEVKNMFVGEEAKLTNGAELRSAIPNLVQAKSPLQ